MFDERIEQVGEPVLEQTAIPKYKPRAMRFDQVLTLGDVQLKLYHTTASADEPIGAEVADKAIAFVQLHLPEKIRKSGGDHGAGYVILHRGLTDHWLLMHWWAGGDICLASMARLKSRESEFGSVDDTSLHACVWEHVVIAHERDAWVRTMMTGDPNVEGYLEDRLSNGLY